MEEKHRMVDSQASLYNNNHLWILGLGSFGIRVSKATHLDTRNYFLAENGCMHERELVHSFDIWGDWCHILHIARKEIW